MYLTILFVEINGFPFLHFVLNNKNQMSYFMCHDFQR